MKNIDGKVVSTEWSSIDLDKGTETVHEHKMYVLDDDGEQVVLNKYKDIIKPIKWEKVSTI